MGGKVSRTVFTSGGVGPDCQTDPEKVTVHLRKGCPEHEAVGCLTRGSWGM